MSYVKQVATRKPGSFGLEPWAMRRRRSAIAAATDNVSGRTKTGLEHCIEIERTHCTSTGPRYRVTYLGEMLVESVRDPEFEACRALLAKGIRGTLVTDSPGSSQPRMKIDIEVGATLTTIENATDSPRIGCYRPHPSSATGDDEE